MRDLIIGSASNFSWEHLQYWVNSIKMSGFEGDIIVTGTGITDETKQKLESKGVFVYVFDENPFKHYAPHVARFLYQWYVLNNIVDRKMYKYVISTDTRDVIFQTNPSDWLRLNDDEYIFVFSTEGLIYCDEPWGKNNIEETFGNVIANTLMDKMICNVGVIAGEFSYMKGLFLDLFVGSINRPIKIVDQAVFNYLAHSKSMSSISSFLYNNSRWSIQLGTTIEAIEAGSGDLGQMCVQDPKMMEQYKNNYKDVQPIIEDGKVKTTYGELISVVHQYDRIPELKKKIQQIYGD